MKPPSLRRSDSWLTKLIAHKDVLDTLVELFKAVSLFFSEVEQRTARHSHRLALRFRFGEREVDLRLTISPRGGSLPTTEVEEAPPATDLGTGEATLQEDWLAELRTYVEQALKDYAWPARFHCTPLLAFLKTRLAQEGRSDPLAAVQALREALDAAIDSLTQTVNSHLTEHRKNAVRYLDLRYREGLTHREAAARLGYEERQLHRIRRELIEAVTEVIRARFWG